MASPQRHLAAIAALDVVGFSGMVEADELATIANWTGLRTGWIEPCVARWHGRVFKTMGDGLLAEFPSALDAVRCMVEIQTGLPEQPNNGQAFRLRCGVHLGDVLPQGDDLLGDGVNIAARLQTVAEAGAIVLSGAVFDQVSGRLALPFRDLGPLELKNLRRKVPAYGLLGGKRADAGVEPHRDRRPTIAVLPFAEHSLPGEDSHLGYGLVEDLTASLAALPDLFVVSHGSTQRYAAEQGDFAEIGRILGVRYLVTGTVRRAQRQLRIAAQLNSLEDRAVLWAQSIEGDVDDVFKLHDALCRRIATTVSPHLQEAELRRTWLKRPDSLDAYDLTLRGHQLIYRLDRAEFDLAIERFRRAIASDPGYALPYAYGALWHSIRVMQGWAREGEDNQGEVARLSHAAIERDPMNATALALGGHVRALLFRDLDGAMALHERAISASPSSAVAWVRSSPTYSYRGESAEARMRAEEGLRLSPLDPHIFFAHSTMALACYTEGDHETAVAFARRAMTENPRFVANLRVLAASLAAAGQGEEARAIGAALLRLQPNFRVGEFCRGYAYREKARLEALERHLRAAGLPA